MEVAAPLQFNSLTICFHRNKNIDGGNSKQEIASLLVELHTKRERQIKSTKKMVSIHLLNNDEISVICEFLPCYQVICSLSKVNRKFHQCIANIGQYLLYSAIFRHMTTFEAVHNNFLVEKWKRDLALHLRKKHGNRIECDLSCLFNESTVHSFPYIKSLIMTFAKYSYLLCFDVCQELSWRTRDFYEIKVKQLIGLTVNWRFSSNLIVVNRERNTALVYGFRSLRMGCAIHFSIPDDQSKHLFNNDNNIVYELRGTVIDCVWIHYRHCIELYLHLDKIVPINQYQKIRLEEIIGNSPFDLSIHQLFNDETDLDIRTEMLFQEKYFAKTISFAAFVHMFQDRTMIVRPEICPHEKLKLVVSDLIFYHNVDKGDRVLITVNMLCRGHPEPLEVKLKTAKIDHGIAVALSPLIIILLYHLRAIIGMVCWNYALVLIGVVLNLVLVSALSIRLGIGLWLLIILWNFNITPYVISFLKAVFVIACFLAFVTVSISAYSHLFSQFKRKKLIENTVIAESRLLFYNTGSRTAASIA